MDDTLQKLLYLFGTIVYGIFMLWVFLRTTGEYAEKENATNEDYLVALIKRMLVYPCLVFIALLTISQYIVS